MERLVNTIPKFIRDLKLDHYTDNMSSRDTLVSLWTDNNFNLLKLCCRDYRMKGLYNDVIARIEGSGVRVCGEQFEHGSGGSVDIVYTLLPDDSKLLVLIVCDNIGIEADTIDRYISIVHSEGCMDNDRKLLCGLLLQRIVAKRVSDKEYLDEHVNDLVSKIYGIRSTVDGNSNKSAASTGICLGNLDTISEELKRINIQGLLQHLNQYGGKANFYMAGNTYCVFASDLKDRAMRVYTIILRVISSSGFETMSLEVVDADEYGYTSVIIAKLSNTSDLIVILPHSGEISSIVKYLSDTVQCICTHAPCGPKEKLMFITKILSLDDNVFKECNISTQSDIRSLLKNFGYSVGRISTTLATNMFNTLYEGFSRNEVKNEQEAQSAVVEDEGFWNWCFKSAPRALFKDAYTTLYSNLYETYTKSKGVLDPIKDKDYLCKEQVLSFIAHECGVGKQSELILNIGEVLDKLNPSAKVCVQYPEGTLPIIVVNEYMNYKTFTKYGSVEGFDDVSNSYLLIWAFGGAAVWVVFTGNNTVPTVEEYYVQALSCKKFKYVSYAWFLVSKCLLNANKINHLSSRYDIDGGYEYFKAHLTELSEFIGSTYEEAERYLDRAYSLVQ